MSGDGNMAHGMFRATRTLMLVAAFLLFAALIWWLGPEIRIGDSRPLDPPGWRIAVILFVPALLLIPLLGGALAWSWRQIRPRRVEAAPDPVRLACRDLLQQLRAHADRAECASGGRDQRRPAHGGGGRTLSRRRSRAPRRRRR